jgi:hypothetical protein
MNPSENEELKYSYNDYLKKITEKDGLVVKEEEIINLITEIWGGY